MTAGEPARDWWREPGGERCPFCLMTYHLEEEVRCTGCDRAGCRECMVTVTATVELWCPECDREEEP